LATREAKKTKKGVRISDGNVGFKAISAIRQQEQFQNVASPISSLQ
jgi:hypothetical protein